MTPADLPARVNDVPHLRRRARVLNADVLVEIAPRSWLLRVRDGAIEAVAADPGPMPSWTFALRFDPAAWGEFLQPVPPPGRHDLMALVKTGKLVMEGNLQPLMAHLLWFKLAFNSLRSAA